MIFQDPIVGICSILFLVLVFLTIFYTLKNLTTELHKYLLYLEIFTVCLLVFYIVHLTNISNLSLMASYGIFIFLTLLVGAFFSFILIYFYEDKIKGFKRFLLILIIPIIVLFSGLTDPWLHLIYVPVVTSTGIIYERGIISNICNIYCSVVLVLMLCLVLFNAVKIKSRRKKRSAYILILGSLINIAFILLFILGHFEVSLTPLGIAITLFCLFLSLYFTDFFNKFPLGWKTFIENSTNAFVVLDTNYVIANFNSKFLEFGGEKKI